MTDAYNTERFEHAGRTFEAAMYYDDTDSDAPWQREDGHGPMREIRSSDEKRPGERIITSGDRNAYIWAYDWQEAMKTARAEWGLGEDETAKLRATLKREPTEGEIAERAVQMDFDRLRGWVRSDWHYCGIAVRIIGPDDEPEGDEYAHAVWGIESDGDYWREVANDLASEIIGERAQAWRAALKEARARRYWASRDVTTV
jgi:hypothetical protein